MNHLTDNSLAEAMEANPSPEARADLLLDYLEAHGNTNYDEAVTQMAHGLQTAALAREEGATAELTVASLFHDLGHLLVSEHASTGDFLDHDLGHEKVAAQYLAPYFGPAVLEPIRLHVRAKRYLCTTDPAYHDGLSMASKRSLEVQGGLLSTEELEELQREPFVDDGVQLRLWDDRAKVTGAVTPSLADFRADVITALQAG